MSRFRFVSIALAASLVLALSAGCAGTQEKPAQTAAQPASGPAADKTLLVATQNMTGHPDDVPETRTETQVGTVRQLRGLGLYYDVVASDPRATGAAEATANIDQRADGSGEMWGSWVLKNDGGTWDGSFSHSLSAAKAAVPDTEYLRIRATGTGAYEGLELLLQGGSGDVAQDFEPGTDHVLTGWIQKSD